MLMIFSKLTCSYCHIEKRNQDLKLFNCFLENSLLIELNSLTKRLISKTVFKYAIKATFGFQSEGLEKSPT